MSWTTEEELTEQVIALFDFHDVDFDVDAILDVADIASDYSNQEPHVCPDCDGNGSHEFPAAGLYSAPFARTCGICNGRGEVKSPNKPQEEAMVVLDVSAIGGSDLCFVCSDCEEDHKEDFITARFKKGEDHTVECGSCGKVI